MAENSLVMMPRCCFVEALYVILLFADVVYLFYAQDDAAFSPIPRVVYDSFMQLTAKFADYSYLS
jgi:hypothetical protein